MTISQPVVPCPTCAEGWKPETAKHCDDCLEGQIERLMSAIERIDAINDNPARFNSEINAVCDAILRPHLDQQRQE